MLSLDVPQQHFSIFLRIRFFLKHRLDKHISKYRKQFTEQKRADLRKDKLSGEDNQTQKASEYFPKFPTLKKNS